MLTITIISLVAVLAFFAFKNIFRIRPSWLAGMLSGETLYFIIIITTVLIISTKRSLFDPSIWEDFFLEIFWLVLPIIKLNIILLPDLNDSILLKIFIGFFIFLFLIFSVKGAFIGFLIRKKEINESKKNRRLKNLIVTTIFSLALLIISIIIIRSYFKFGSVKNSKIYFSKVSNFRELTAEELSEYVDVRKIDLNIKSSSKPFINEEVLWNVFSNNQHHNSFGYLNNNDWIKNYIIYNNALIKKAKEKGLNYKSLEKCLEKIKPDDNGKLALIPTAAYLARQRNREIWIIVCNWEYVYHQKDSEFGAMMHIRIFAFRTSNQKLIGYITCA